MGRIAVFLLVFGLHFAVPDTIRAEAPVPDCLPASIIEAAPGAATCRWLGHGRLIHFARPALPARDGRPLLFLVGGPGAYAAPSKAHIAMLADRLGRTVILPDIFGSDTSDESLQRALRCRLRGKSSGPGGFAETAHDAEIVSRDLEAELLHACLLQLDLTPALRGAMSTGHTAAELKAMRQMFAIAGWDLLAESYGGRLALALAAVDGDAIGKIILDSPETPWNDGFFRTGENFAAALVQLSDLCRANSKCPARKLRLEEVLPARIAKYAADDQQAVGVRNGRTGAVEAYARLNREQMLTRVYMALRTPSGAAHLPFVSLAYSDSDLQRRFLPFLSGLLDGGDDLSFSLYHSVRCTELPLGRWYAALEAEKQRYPNLAPFLDYLGWRQSYVCNALGIVSPDAIAVPQRPDLPILVLSGELDPVTPPDVVAGAFSPMPVGTQQLRYAATGHIVHRQRPCAIDDIAAFLADGPAAVETTCSKADLKISFFVPVTIR
ncbi:MAG: alpha/beta hydrolase [Alphaproteobacteria bacterium]|nr:MAG: alpha/beta hydrolase [Alphaproteobacteria bacterium]